MIETPLQQQFNAIAAALDGDGQVKDAKAFLGILQSATRSLREEGFNAELEVRPYQYKARRAEGVIAWANATLSIDGIGLDFMVIDRGAGGVAMQAKLGDVEVFLLNPLTPGPAGTAGNQTANGAGSLAAAEDKVIKLVLQVKAAGDLFGAYGVDATSLPPEKLAEPRLKALSRSAGGEGP